MTSITERLHVFRNFRLGEFPVVPMSGRGSRVYDVEGREYIDYLLGSGPLILGHGHPRVLAAVERRLRQGVQFFMPTTEAASLADEIIDAVPCAEAVHFVSSGTEATYFALRLARAYTTREKILKFEGAYHGWHDYGMMSSAPHGCLSFPEAEADTPGIPAPIRDLVLVAPFNDLATTRSILKHHAQDLAAIIVEPYQRFISPVPGFLEGLRSLTAEFGILLIYDEVATGFRLAYGGGQEYYRVVPDLTALGKAVGGGLTLGAVCGRAEIMELCSPVHSGASDWVPRLGTFNGNPLSVTAGLATLQELQSPDTYSQLHALGARLREGLRQILKAFGRPFQVLGDGPTFKILFTETQVQDYRSSLSADNELLQRFELEWLRRGIYIAPGRRHYISLAHDSRDLDMTLEKIELAAEATLC